MKYRNYKIKYNKKKNYADIYFKNVYQGCVDVIKGTQDEVIKEAKDFIDNVLIRN